MSTIHQKSADNIRALAVAMVEKAKSGHPGGPMGGADFMHILYSEFMRFDPDNMGFHGCRTLVSTDVCPVFFIGIVFHG